MGCGCKSKVNNLDKDKIYGSDLLVKLIIYIVSVVIVSLILIPVVYPFIVIMLFFHIVIDRKINLTQFLVKIFKKKEINDNEDSLDNSNDFN